MDGLSATAYHVLCQIRPGTSVGPDFPHECAPNIIENLRKSIEEIVAAVPNAKEMGLCEGLQKELVVWVCITKIPSSVVIGELVKNGRLVETDGMLERPRISNNKFH